MKNIVEFIRAVLRHWVYLLTSSAAIALVTTWEHIHGSSIEARVFNVLALLLLGVAFFKSWSEEHLKVGRLINELASARDELKLARQKLLEDEASTKFLNAQRMELEVQQSEREAAKKREEKIRFLTAPGSGIREYAQKELSRVGQKLAFTADTLASVLNTPQSEIEEALIILKSRGFARETTIKGRWIIEP